MLPVSRNERDDASTNSVPACERQRLVIVGGGMAAYGLCAGLARHALTERLAVTIIGEEPQPAYDRVNASKIFSDRPIEKLLLAPRQWYQDHRIALHVGRRIDRIDPQTKCVVDCNGKMEPYDQLVLATGSYAWVPPIPGVENRGVFVYRTIDDLLGIRDYVSQSQSRRAAVIGGGLLGLEAAKVLVDLGLETSVLEVAPGLMPRQLDRHAAAILRQRVEAMGVAVHVVRRTERVDANDGGLTIHFQNAKPLDVDVLVIAAGVRPRDELAKAAGLVIGKRGGVVIDPHLQTSDPNIFAIGECASFNQHLYGLVAPCYRMADVLADRMAGLPSEFTGADESAELKLLGVPVVALGRPIGEASAGVVLKHEDAGGYRKIILEQGRITGAAGVGEWDEIRLLRHAINKQQRLWPHQRSRFCGRDACGRDRRRCRLASCLTTLLASGFAIAPPMPFSASVQGEWRRIDALWRDDLLKQASSRPRSYRLPHRSSNHYFPAKQRMDTTRSNWTAMPAMMLGWVCDKLPACDVMKENSRMPMTRIQRLSLLTPPSRLCWQRSMLKNV